MKNKGSLLLELGVSIFVILIVITMAFSINKMILNSTKKKINTYEMEESLHSIINEVKYNIKYEKSNIEGKVIKSYWMDYA